MMFLYLRIVGVLHSVLAGVALSNMPLRGRATSRLQTCATRLVDGLVQLEASAWRDSGALGLSLEVDHFGGPAHKRWVERC
jgi:hypothetical protein